MVDESAFQLDQAIGFHVNRVAFLMSEEIARRFATAGYPLSAQDFGILYRLGKQGPMTQVELATAMLRDKTTITRRLDGLVNKQLIERRPHPKDRRCCLIMLTEQGETALAQTQEIVHAFQQEVLRGTSEADQRITIRTLQRIAAHLIPTAKEKA